MREWLPLASCVLVVTWLPAQQDLRVPSQFPHVQAAVDFASPGDRILIETAVQAQEHLYGDLVIDKSLTIESAVPGQPQTIGVQAGSCVQVTGEVRVEQLTPGIPFVLRDLSFWFRDGFSCGATSFGLRVVARAGGRMENVTMRNSQFLNWYPATVAEITTDRVWLRDCVFEGLSIGPSVPCFDPTFSARGGSALSVTADVLMMEGCTMTGGDASYLRYTPSCDPPQEFGNGGAALGADTTTTILTRCRLQDGNGSWFQSGPWTSVPATVSGNSTLTGAAGRLIAHDTLLTVGLDGQVGPQPTTHGATVQIGVSESSLTLQGGRLGQLLTASVALVAQEATAVIFGGKWGYTSTVYGALALDLSIPVAAIPVVPPWSASAIIPVDPALVGVSLVAQVVHLRGGVPTMGNASGVWFAR